MDKVIILHSKHAARFPAARAELIFFDHPLDYSRLSKIESVQLWSPAGDKIESLPEAVAAMTELKSLSIGPGSMSVSIINEAKEGDFPEGLEELRVHVGLGVIKWPGFVLPNLVSLYVDVVFRFKNSSFPKLRSLSIVPDKTLNSIKQLDGTDLEELNLLSVPVGDEIFDIIPTIPLISLGLLSGTKIKSIAGVVRFPGMISLRLKNLSSLRDISALAVLPELRVLDIQCCKKIEGISVINELRLLTELTLVGCGKVGLDVVADKLQTLGKKTIGGTS